MIVKENNKYQPPTPINDIKDKRNKIKVNKYTQSH